MKAIEKYQQFGLKHPITLWPSIIFRLLLWGGGGFFILLLLGCIGFLAKGNLLEKLIGAFCILLFGACLAMIIYIFVQSRSRGVLELSKEGIYMSNIGYALPWKDIGPIWIYEKKFLGIKLPSDVAFVLTNVSRHTEKMDSIGRFLINIHKKASHSKSGGALDLGLIVLSFVANFFPYERVSTEFLRMRDAVMNNPDSTVFYIPLTLCPGISAEDLVGIINREVAFNKNLL